MRAYGQAGWAREARFEAPLLRHQALALGDGLVLRRVARRLTGFSEGRVEPDRHVLFAGFRWPRGERRFKIMGEPEARGRAEGRHAHLIPAGASLAGTVEGLGEVEFLLLEVEPWAAERAAGGAAPPGFTLLPRPELDDPVAWALLDLLRAAEATAAGDPAGRLFAESLGAALLARLVLRHSTLAPAGEAPRVPGGLDRRAAAAARAFVEDRLHHDIGLRDLARAAGLSPWHFARAFKASFGCTPARYVLARRLERAEALLRATALPVAEVALRCGFADPHRFAARFRAHAGAGPRAFRRERRGG